MTCGYMLVKTKGVSTEYLCMVTELTSQRTTEHKLYTQSKDEIIHQPELAINQS